MIVSLTAELERFVNQKVESGKYQTVSEVIRDGLRLLLEREVLHQQKLDDLRREINIGINQGDKGRIAPVNAKGILARARQSRQCRKDG